MQGARCVYSVRMERKSLGRGLCDTPRREAEGGLLCVRAQVWVNTEVSDDGRHTVGHTKNYVKVLLPFDPALEGAVVTVSKQRAC
jgi:hypothetical protein